MRCRLCTNPVRGDGGLCTVHLVKAAIPRWRHWHVEGRDFGYTMGQAFRIADEDSAYYGVPIDVERCDVDHSLEDRA